MRFVVFLDLIISGAFMLGAYLFYLAHKDNIKTLKEKWEEKGFFLWDDKIKSYFIIFSMVILSLVYFFSFLGQII